MKKKKINKNKQQNSIHTMVPVKCRSWWSAASLESGGMLYLLRVTESHCVTTFHTWRIRPQFIHMLIQKKSYTLEYIYLDILLDFSTTTHIEIASGRDLLMVSMNRRNDYSKQNLFRWTYGHLTIVLRQTWKIVNPSFKAQHGNQIQMISISVRGCG